MPAGNPLIFAAMDTCAVLVIIAVAGETASHAALSEAVNFA